MLSLASGSGCDVCLEPYGGDQKAPYAIRCGHVYCLSCLNNIQYSTCPLCRMPYDSHASIKLHLDLDAVDPSGATAPSTPAAQEARRLQDVIANMANEGATEARMKQIMAEARTFLNTHPRNLFPDLRVNVRLMAYIYELKMKNRSQKQASEVLKAQNAQLDEEKIALEKQAADLRHLVENAMNEQMRLRQHVSDAHSAYEVVIEQYNFVVREWMKVTQDLQHVRAPSNSNSLGGDPGNDILDTEDNSHSTPWYFAPELDQSKLRGVATQEPDSYLISPLPQFTGRLPSCRDGFSLPDVDEEDEDAQEKSRRASLYANFDCGAVGHPLSCECEPFPIFPSSPLGPHRLPTDEVASTPSGTPSSMVNEAPVGDASNRPSGLSRTAPRGPVLMHGRDNSRSRSSSSRPSSRPSSPSMKPASLLSSQARATVSLDVQAPSLAHISNLSGVDNEKWRSQQLRTVLRESQTGVSSASLPNMSSSHFPISLTREKSGHSEGNPPSPQPHSGLSSSRRPSPLHNSASKLLASHPVSVDVSPANTPSPTPGRGQVPTASSSASSAAAIIEKQQLEKKKAEKERRKAEKEREHANGGKDQYLDAPVERARTNSYHATPPQRELANFYGNPNHSLGSTSRRGSSASANPISSSRPVLSFSSSSSHSSNVPAPHHMRYPTATGKSPNAMPTLSSNGMYVS